jgi:hypothetical protein
MQVSRKPSECSFDPFTFEVTIESVEDLRDLWVRVNASPTVFRDSLTYPAAKAGTSPCTPLFRMLDNEAKARGYP